jgi:predicted RecA/RadA family phage recombinase
MATNFVKEGDILTFTAPTGGVVSGTAYLIGGILCVAMATVAETLEFEGRVSGVFTLPKANSQAWTEGQKIYWDDSAKVCTNVATAGQLIGVAAAEVAVTLGLITGQVRLNGGAPSALEGPQATIVALTDSTGGSATHDDTLADGLTAVAPAATTPYAAVTNLSATVTKAEGELISAALATAVSELTALRAIVASLVTDVTVQNQNDSDLAQKILEFRTALIAAGIIAAA